MVMGSVENSKPHYLAMFHDDGRFFERSGGRAKPVVFNLLQTFSTDGAINLEFPQNHIHEIGYTSLWNLGIICPLRMAANWLFPQGKQK